MKGLISYIKRLPNCNVASASGLPPVPGYPLPKDVIEFYQECGGCDLFTDKPYAMSIVAPVDFVKANPVIAMTHEPTGDISDDWFIVGKSSEQYVTIDLNDKRFGLCYDSFWDRHAVAGSCPIIATTFSEFMEKIVADNGDKWYWTSPQFSSPGDAYRA
jgi:hypothetical protein